MHIHCAIICIPSNKGHKHSYNASSCVDVIFGKDTRRLLYVGVQNKFCTVCAKDASKSHKCYKNWSGSSSSMESDIILEGFHKAEPMIYQLHW